MDLIFPSFTRRPSLVTGTLESGECESTRSHRRSGLLTIPSRRHALLLVLLHDVHVHDLLFPDQIHRVLVQRQPLMLIVKQVKNRWNSLQTTTPELTLLSDSTPQ